MDLYFPQGRPRHIHLATKGGLRKTHDQPHRPGFKPLPAWTPERLKSLVRTQHAILAGAVGGSTRIAVWQFHHAAE
jgi:hypothetical protein